jgi:sec-independent protein translocase protein TatC
MADDSESDRPSSDADESEGAPSDDAETTESSDTPTGEASAPSDDADSDGSASGDDAGDTAEDAVDGGDSVADADDGAEMDGDDETGTGGDTGTNDDTGTDDSDTGTRPESEPSSAEDRPDIAATAEGRPGTETDPDDVDDPADEATLGRERLVEPPAEETSAPSDDTAEDADDTETDGEDDADGADAEDLWPEDHAPPEPKTADELRYGEGEDGEAVADTDGGAPTVSGGSHTDLADDDLDDGMFGDGPETDQEMPLADHIEEMVNRLAAVFLVGGLVTLLLYPGADLANQALNLNLVSSTDVINFLWNKHIPGAPEIADRRPRVYGPLELVLTELKVAGLAGLVVGLPVFVYQTYLFMRPGLFPRERRYYLAAVPTSLVLAFVGIAFAHFVVLPAIFAYFTSYTQGTAVIAFGLKETFNLILILMGYNAIIFQIPLFIMLAIMMNLVTREWLVARRLIFWASFLGLAFFVSPDPTGMAPIIIAATMITLFEGTLFLLRWTGN